MKLVKQKRLERISHWIAGCFYRPLQAWPQIYHRLLPKIKENIDGLSQLNDQELKHEIQLLRKELYKNGHTNSLVANAFALVSVVTKRTLGMSHFDSQLLCGLALFYGNVAEMATGEGKTLTATLPAVTAAIAGIPVHIVTVNDYLARRDAEFLSPVYNYFGLSVGLIVQGLTLTERRKAYACDVVYCTNKELAFDYLKDLIRMGYEYDTLYLQAKRLKGTADDLHGLLLRGLHYCIVDEADSVWIDEARTPMIISGQEITNHEEMRIYRQAVDLGLRLVKGEHFNLDIQKRKVELTVEGDHFVVEQVEGMSPYWVGDVRRHELINKALIALYLFKRDRHYLVRDGKIQIIDENTGRVMPDRAWERGLHQLIEIKEDCEPSKARETLATISFQRFFRLYHHFCGMTGTAKEVKGELWSVYGMPVVRVPTHQPCQRQFLGKTLFTTAEKKWQGVVNRIINLKQKGRPVLVGTRTVYASDALSKQLQAEGVEHHILNAKQDSDEALVIAQAGQMGQVTIATNMAGRGTDIKLAKEVKAAGGLHVILTELHDSGRIDRQLEGRCGRLGDPGSYEIMVSLDDQLLQNWQANRLGSKLINSLGNNDTFLNYFGYWLIKFEQKRLERLHAKRRGELVKADDKQSELLSFAGRRI